MKRWKLCEKLKQFFTYHHWTKWKFSFILENSINSFAESSQADKKLFQKSIYDVETFSTTKQNFPSFSDDSQLLRFNISVFCVSIFDLLETFSMENCSCRSNFSGALINFPLCNHAAAGDKIYVNPRCWVHATPRFRLLILHDIIQLVFTTGDLVGRKLKGKQTESRDKQLANLLGLQTEITGFTLPAMIYHFPCWS